MHYPDLSPYRYAVSAPLARVFHVGWLSRDVDYRTGRVAEDIVARLRSLAATQPANQMRGYHNCEICNCDEPQFETPKGLYVLGAAEIWVPDPVLPTIYAAPNLIIHYIDAHGYQPPEVFVHAVGAVDSNRWNGADVCDRLLDRGSA